jgi:predicted ABC-type ATPase
MSEKNPHVIVIAGPNGAGKSTTAPMLLKGTLGVTEFVNADVIAQGLSAFQPESAAFHAGRVMLERLHYLANERVDFAFETTLASRSFAPWIAKLKQSGYTFHLVFLWLPNPDFAVARVAERVRMGGHDVPEETIRRRYNKGIENFFRLYRPLSVTWRIYDNSEPSWPRIVADGRGDANETIYDPKTWSLIRGGRI